MEKDYFSQEAFERALEQEISIFHDKKYNYTDDLRDAYKRSLQVPIEKRIFDKIPDHVFWDIKTPLTKEPIVRKGKYNPVRGRDYDDYFEMADTEEYLTSQHAKRHLNDAISRFRRY